MDLRNSDGIESRNFYIITVWKIFSNIFIRSGRNASCGAQFGTFKSFYTFEDIESRAKLHKKLSESLGAD